MRRLAMTLGLLTVASAIVIGMAVASRETTFVSKRYGFSMSLPGGAARYLLTPGGLNVTPGRSAAVAGCAQLGKLKSVFPAARAAGLTERLPVKVEPARQPVWPGRCGAFWTTYRGDGRTVDVDVTLYKTPHDVSAALAEPMFGATHILANGARIRTLGPSAPGVAGFAGTSTSVVSAFRNLFISSLSISTSMRPVSISAQLRMHRLIENAFTR